MFERKEDIENRIEGLEKEIIKRKESIEDKQRIIEMYRNSLKEMNKLYYVKFVDLEMGYLNKNNCRGYISLSDKTEIEDFKTKFTEEEIKEIDPRYWQFAIPVEDVCE